MKNGLAPAILAKQKEEGYWEEPKNFYTAKYKGTVWQLLILAELGADITEDKIKKACEFILNHSQDKESGGFAYSTTARKVAVFASTFYFLSSGVLICRIREPSCVDFKTMPSTFGTFIFSYIVF